MSKKQDDAALLLNQIMAAGARAVGAPEALNQHQRWLDATLLRKVALGPNKEKAKKFDPKKLKRKHRK